MRVKRLFRWGRINMKKEEVTELEHTQALHEVLRIRHIRRQEVFVI
jgi:hypothetical protein